MNRNILITQMGKGKLIKGRPACPKYHTVVLQLSTGFLDLSSLLPSMLLVSRFPKAKCLFSNAPLLKQDQSTATTHSWLLWGWGPPWKKQNHFLSLECSCFLTPVIPSSLPHLPFPAQLLLTEWHHLPCLGQAASLGVLSSQKRGN